MNTRTACTPPVLRATAAAMAFAAAPGAWAQTEIAFTLIPGGPQQITAAAVMPGNPSRMFVLTRFGGVRALDLATDTFLPGAIAGFQSDGSSNGTTGLAFHPRFAENGLFYVWRGISVIHFRMIGNPLTSVYGYAQDAAGELYLCGAAGLFRIRPSSVEGRDLNNNGTLDSCEPFCGTDFNADGALGPDDLSDFTAGYFAQPPRPACDWDRSGSIDPDDLATYVAAYFACVG